MTTKTTVREHEGDMLVESAVLGADDVVVLTLVDPDGDPLPPWTPGAHVDLILGPTTPNPAWKLGEKGDDPVAAYLEDIYTITANLAGIPGLSMPAGFVDGLPVGVQLLAPYFQEGRLLNVAHQYQQATDWHQRAPEGF